MLDADLTFPLILGPDGRVMDGMHRIARALLDGRDQVSAVRFLTLPEPDYRTASPPISHTDQRPPADEAFRVSSARVLRPRRLTCTRAAFDLRS